MSKNISIIEDLIGLMPISPFSVSLDNKKEQKDTIILSESLNFEESEELIQDEQIILYTADIKLYLEASEINTNFDEIYSFLQKFYNNVRQLESTRYKEKYIFSVKNNGLFGYLGRDKTGLYCFSLNFRIKYYI